MRAVQFRDQKWFFSKKGNLQGLRTGDDCCTEHECGMKPIQEAFGLDESAEGLERFRVTRLPEEFEFFSNEEYTGFIYRDWYPVSAEESAMRSKPYNKDGDPVVAWDDDSFLIMVPSKNKKDVKTVKALWEAFQSKDMLLGGKFSPKFAGSGIGFYIASKMPKEEIDQANEALIADAKRRQALMEATEKEGFNEVVKELREAGRDWFYLGPKIIRDDGRVGYWLNPQDQENNLFGMVTIDDLKHWIKGKGRIPANMPE